MNEKDLWDLGIPNTYNGTTVYTNKAGQYHRIGGPAIIDADGSIYYYQYGMLHNSEGPAIMVNSKIHWYYQFGKLHRLDGPAISHYKEPHLNQWYIDGVQYETEEQFNTQQTLHRKHYSIIEFPCGGKYKVYKR